MKILAISGSLRKASLNSAILRVVQQLAAQDIEVRLYEGLGDLPLFNPDIVDEPPGVAQLREQINAADVVLIASPEYAHGVTGAMKNALDWMVGNESFVYKPVVLLNTSPRASHAQAALHETLKTMSARMLDEASISLPILGSGLDEAQMHSEPFVRDAINDMLNIVKQQITT